MYLKRFQHNFLNCTHKDKNHGTFVNSISLLDDAREKKTTQKRPPETFNTISPNLNAEKAAAI